MATNVVAPTHRRFRAVTVVPDFPPSLLASVTAGQMSSFRVYLNSDLPIGLSSSSPPPPSLSPKYVLTVLDSSRPSTSFAVPCAVVVVPPGRESSYIFATKNGLASVQSSASCQRLLSLSFDRRYDPVVVGGGARTGAASSSSSPAALAAPPPPAVTVALLNAELSDVVQSLASSPRRGAGKTGQADQHPPTPFMTVGPLDGRDCIGKGALPLSGGYVVEQVPDGATNGGESEQLQGTFVRRLFFNSAENVVQSECRLAKRRGGGGGGGIGGCTDLNLSKDVSRLSVVPRGYVSTTALGPHHSSNYVFDHLSVSFPYHLTLASGLALLPPAAFVPPPPPPSSSSSSSHDSSSRTLPVVVVVGCGGGALSMYLSSLLSVSTAAAAPTLAAAGAGGARPSSVSSSSSSSSSLSPQTCSRVRVASVLTAELDAGVVDLAVDYFGFVAACVVVGATTADQQAGGSSEEEEELPTLPANTETQGGGKPPPPPPPASPSSSLCPSSPSCVSSVLVLPPPSSSLVSDYVVVVDGLSLRLPPSSVLLYAIDVDSKDQSVGMSCPPVAFTSVSYLLSVRESLAEGGVLAINVSARDGKERDNVAARLGETFGREYVFVGTPPGEEENDDDDEDDEEDEEDDEDEDESEDEGEGEGESEDESEDGDGDKTRRERKDLNVVLFAIKGSIGLGGLQSKECRMQRVAAIVDGAVDSSEKRERVKADLIECVCCIEPWDFSGSSKTKTKKKRSKKKKAEKKKPKKKKPKKKKKKKKNGKKGEVEDAS